MAPEELLNCVYLHKFDVEEPAGYFTAALTNMCVLAGYALEGNDILVNTVFVLLLTDSVESTRFQDFAALSQFASVDL